ncbi:hypothetical protein HMPREF9104_01396 [Lentilactobacillus kisonensis F0435]|uniref:Uncharacterized protein n=1 Tax=Lentilactobacillus kisonensis F0435 TaxID=797516 RepID=H1LFM0_9LACO|nr:hypothetical protein HMPREF9104_01396 [Lentilactobacillus kisonensis F0435]
MFRSLFFRTAASGRNFHISTSIKNSRNGIYDRGDLYSSF